MANIVLVGPIYPYRGGIAHYNAMLARAFAANGSQVHVVSFRRQYPAWLYPGKSDRDPSHQPVSAEAEFWLDPLNPLTWLQSARRIAAWEPAVVIFQWWVTFWSPAYSFLASWLRRRGIKILFIIHNVMPHEPRFWDRWLARLALRQALSFIVQTDREKLRLLSVLPGVSVEVIPHPVYDMFKGSSLSAFEAKQTLGLSPNIPVALMFGIIRQYKGLKFALQAIGELYQQGQPVQLLVGGEFWENMPAYLQLAKDLRVEHLVKFDNRYIPNEEISIFFSAADLFLAPYIGGTQSGAVKIGLSFGLPVVISRAIVSADLENDSAHRLYWVEPGDPHSLATAIRQCLLDGPPAGLPPAPPVDEWAALAARIKERL